jgi:phosphate transport system permease protein
MSKKNEILGEMSLERSLFEPRALVSSVLTGFLWIVAIVASVPLFSVLYRLIVQGGNKLSLDVFTQLPPAGFEQGGGFGNAIAGTLVTVGFGALFSIPMGIFAAIYLSEIQQHGKLTSVARFCAKTLTGLPSILAGVFAYAAVVMVTGTFSALAAGVALSILMLPTVVLTAEEAMLMVPANMKNAAFGIGCTRSQVIWKIVLPTALPGILTGVMLAIARAAGETAPLLFTALFSNFWFIDNGKVLIMSPIASLSVFIFNFSGMPFENQIDLAWTASLVLVMMMLVFNILARILGRKKY